MHPKLDNPLLSDAFCDLFPSMASRSQSEMCCVDRHIHPLHERLRLWAHPQCRCLSAGAFWFANLVVTASRIVDCMRNDMPRATVEGSANFWVSKSGTPPPSSKVVWKPRGWADRGAETRIPGVLGAHSSRRDGGGLRPLPCPPFAIVGLSFGPATPPKSSSDILGFRQIVRSWLKVSYFSTHSDTYRYTVVCKNTHNYNFGTTVWIWITHSTIRSVKTCLKQLLSKCL